DKTISYWSALIRGSAVKNGHNPDVGEAFMNKEHEVKIGERVVHAKGSLLTLNAQEAAEVIDGKPLLAAGIADSMSDLVTKANLKGQVVTVEPTGFERLALWITALAPLLLLGGIVFAWLEFKIPGASLPGVLAAICFALFFLGHYLAGLAGWEVVALFVLGVVLVLCEIIFFAHSTILVGLIGVALVLGSLLWAMIDRYPGQTFFPTGPMLRIPVLNLLMAMVAAIFVMVLLARYLPRTSVYRRFVLSADIPSGPSLTGKLRDFHPAIEVTPGTEGRAVTMLRPSGKARFGEHVVDVVTEGDFIPADSPVAVTSIDGMRVVVKSAT
ncbi:MAG TPA: NfeD family protein, partial [Chthoniobacterales bacterium]